MQLLLVKLGDLLLIVAIFNLNQLGYFKAVSPRGRLAGTLPVNRPVPCEFFIVGEGSIGLCHPGMAGSASVFAKPFLKRTPGKLRAVQNACRDIRGAGDFRSMAGAAGLLAWFRSGFRGCRRRSGSRTPVAPAYR